MSGIIFNIERFAIHDGPGIRTLVFMKGCPLRCLWCSNPEGQKLGPEILFNTDKCNVCAHCIDECTMRLFERTHDERKMLIKRENCNGCGDCIDVCRELGAVALQLAGERVSVKEILSEIEKDRIFYDNSGGGATLSGGEPLMQPEFSLELLKQCREVGLHTAMETSGYAPLQVFKKISSSADLVLFDIKHMDSGLHEEFTGVSNRLILRNAKWLSDSRIPTIVRIPLIPGYNDCRSNLERTAAFISRLNVEKVDLLPYHPFGSSKYKMLGREYRLVGLEPQDKGRMLEVKNIIESTASLDVRIGG